ncbi:hypothetical protein KC340_g4461 [Hortaea werneckii]|nr:hypothetical protein KC342_g4640 [Hortaea werneckii]KAI7096580.1 hypothetical protein KC339_g10267 [Hortaea werneckii]KAI7205850.1 hypothetical protein KC365_g17506 [Hortaea werneckii]KAI7329875.1 hypothetical protein KC340_g4461 [Hortaea werneckii]KAI7400495.1 hypothetical protein KC328_g3571 [Hortaea werneckii]
MDPNAPNNLTPEEYQQFLQWRQQQQQQQQAPPPPPPPQQPVASQSQPASMSRAQASKYDIANQLLYNPILALVKASVICFLWRLKDRRKSIRWSLGLLFAINLGLAIATFVADLCQCTPVSYYWDHHETDNYDAEGDVIEKGGICIQQVEFFLITAGLSVWTEIILMSISMAVVLSLKMKKASKIAIGTVMPLGWIVVLIGITRIVLYYYRFQPNNVDRSYSLSYTISGAEVNM